MKKIGILISCFMLISVSCEDFLMEKFYPIGFFNNTGQEIKMTYNKPGNKPEFGNLYPDTSVPEREPAFSIPPHKDRSSHLQIKYEEFFKHIPSDTLTIFFFYGDTLQAYPWDTIRSTYKVAQRYDLSLQDLKNRDFRLEFPYDSLKGKLKVWSRE